MNLAKVRHNLFAATFNTSYLFLVNFLKCLLGGRLGDSSPWVSHTSSQSWWMCRGCKLLSIFPLPTPPPGLFLRVYAAENLRQSAGLPTTHYKSGRSPRSVSPNRNTNSLYPQHVCTPPHFTDMGFGEGEGARGADMFMLTIADVLWAIKSLSLTQESHAPASANETVIR